jgi:hypothetical protein
LRLRHELQQPLRAVIVALIRDFFPLEKPVTFLGAEFAADGHTVPLGDFPARATRLQFVHRFRATEAAAAAHPLLTLKDVITNRSVVLHSRSSPLRSILCGYAGLPSVP